MKLSLLLKELTVKTVSGNIDCTVNGICYDSRKAKKDFMFVCVVGFETDGHKYIESAVKSGASVVVVQAGAKVPEIDKDVTVVCVEDTKKALAILAASFYGHPEKRLKIIGVTGTNGKTTVTTLTKSILEFEGKKVGLIGTNANMIGDRVIPTERTTPESLELYKLFCDMVREGVEYVVMEVSSHALELNRVYGIEFEAGAFTNLTQDHLDFHITMGNYLNAKKKLFELSKKSIINKDDAAGATILKEFNKNAISYGIDSDADIKASDIKISSRGVIFKIDFDGKESTVRLAIPGRFSVYNALTAIGIVASLGVPVERAAEALTFAKGVTGRCEKVYTGTDYAVIIDYAHTPDGLENIIKTVREFTENRVITLFGCGGDRDRTKRPIMGEVAGSISDYLIVTSDNPRTEEPHSIIEEIIVGVEKTGCEYVVIDNRREAIEFALKFAKSGDSIILAGKGHETYQIIGKEKIHFDEREIVCEYLDDIKKSEVEA